MNMTLKPSQPNEVYAVVLSVAILVAFVDWFVGASFAITSLNALSTVHIFWLLSVMVAPVVCFAFGIILNDNRRNSRFTWLTRVALIAATFPVTLGTVLSAWTLRELFWFDFQHASILSQGFAAVAIVGLKIIAGSMITRSILNSLTRQSLN